MRRWRRSGSSARLAFQAARSAPASSRARSGCCRVAIAPNREAPTLGTPPCGRSPDARDSDNSRTAAPGRCSSGADPRSHSRQTTPASNCDSPSRSEPQPRLIRPRLGHGAVIAPSNPPNRRRAEAASTPSVPRMCAASCTQPNAMRIAGHSVAVASRPDRAAPSAALARPDAPFSSTRPRLSATASSRS